MPLIDLTQGVRTADDASLTVKVMVFFQLTDIELMLNSTHDPIGDFINALLADMMNFGCRNSYEQFIQQAHKLSELSTFPVLCSRAASVGFTVGKVVYRGYTASNQLQSLCDQAIKTRTELKLKAEEEEQRERARDNELRGATGRGDAERAQEAARQKHKLVLEAARHAEALKRAEEEHAGRLRQQQERARAELEAKVAADKAHREHLEGLKALGVDLTRLLVAQEEKKPDKVIKVLTDAEAGAPGPIHIHTNLDVLNGR